MAIQKKQLNGRTVYAIVGTDKWATTEAKARQIEARLGRGVQRQLRSEASKKTKLKGLVEAFRSTPSTDRDLPSIGSYVEVDGPAGNFGRVRKLRGGGKSGTPMMYEVVYEDPNDGTEWVSTDRVTVAGKSAPKTSAVLGLRRVQQATDYIRRTWSEDDISDLADHIGEGFFDMKLYNELKKKVPGLTQGEAVSAIYEAYELDD